MCLGICYDHDACRCVAAELSRNIAVEFSCRIMLPFDSFSMMQLNCHVMSPINFLAMIFVLFDTKSPNLQILLYPGLNWTVMSPMDCVIMSRLN